MKLRLPFIIISRHALIERDASNIHEGYCMGYEAAEERARAARPPRPASPKPKKARP